MGHMNNILNENIYFYDLITYLISIFDEYPSPKISITGLNGVKFQFIGLPITVVSYSNDLYIEFDIIDNCAFYRTDNIKLYGNYIIQRFKEVRENHNA